MTMTDEQKKALLLLKALIFYFHGLDDDEKRILEESAEKLGAQPALDWVYEFIGDDHFAALNKARDYFSDTIATYDKETKLNYLNTVWEATHEKGYITELEATYIMKFANDWGVEKELMELVRKGS